MKLRSFCPVLFGLMFALILLSSQAQQNPPKVPLSQDLSQQAAQTAVVTPPDVGDTDDYFWIADKQLLFLRPTPSGKQFRAVLVDAQSGTKTLPAAFNTYATPLMPRVETMTVSYTNSPQVKHIFSPPHSVPSPDGKWLLWQGRNTIFGGKVVVSWRAATLDGSQKRQWKAAPEAESAFWLPDGQKWVELIQHVPTYSGFDRAVIHPLSPQGSPREVRWTGVGDCVPLGLTDNNSVLLHQMNRSLPARQSRAVLEEVGLRRKTESARLITVKLPHPAEVADVVLAPTGDRIAWLLTDGTAYSTRGEVWLSDRAGLKMRLLGRLEGENAWERSLHWLPNGKQLSFLHQSRLCTIPVGTNLASDLEYGVR